MGGFEGKCSFDIARTKRKTNFADESAVSYHGVLPTLRTNIQFASAVDDTKVILMTSTAPGKGKTSTATNLAVVSATAGKRVLLIDADMRKPQVHQRFQVLNLYGLSTLLIRERTLEECVVSADTEKLFF